MAQLFPFAGLALLALGELALFGFAADANVSEAYRAYYIDQTSSCLPQPVSGAFELGQPISASGMTPAAFDAVAVCGVAYMRPEGTWIFGPEARFRFAVPAGTGDLLLTLDGRPGTESGRRLTVSANGTGIGTLHHAGDADAMHTVTVPRQVLPADGELQLTLVVEDPPRIRNSVSARQFTFLIRSLTLSLQRDERGSASSGTAP